MFDTSEARKAFQSVFDAKTQRALLKLGDRGLVNKVYGEIESGKESAIFLADSSEHGRILLKIYMTRAGSFREMKQYLRGDKRFRNVKDDRRSVIEEWTKKEFRNLQKASDIVSCPEAITCQNNILAMEFIGEEFSPYPKLKDVEIENPQTGYQQVIKGIERLWKEKKIVHGDLSEYNILVEEDRLVWIDFSQGVHKTHPEAKNLLRRDIDRVSDFFRRQGAEVKPQNVFERIISG